MNLQELKRKTPAELLAFAENLEIEAASALRKQDMMFAILKQLAENGTAIYGDGVLEILQDGFGFLRSPEANYLPGPDDIYVSPSQVRRFSLRTGDTVEGQIRSPKDGERYFAMLKVNQINDVISRRVIGILLDAHYVARVDGQPDRADLVKKVPRVAVPGIVGKRRLPIVVISIPPRIFGSHRQLLRKHSVRVEADGRIDSPASLGVRQAVTHHQGVGG